MLEPGERYLEAVLILSEQKSRVCSPDAAEGACKIEHDLGDESFETIKRLMN